MYVCVYACMHAFMYVYMGAGRRKFSHKQDGI